MCTSGANWSGLSNEYGKQVLGGDHFQEIEGNQDGSGVGCRVRSTLYELLPVVIYN